jgi:hypothetical protein
LYIIYVGNVVIGFNRILNRFSIGQGEFKMSNSTNAMAADRQRAQRLTERRANGAKARQTIPVPASAVLTGLHPMVAAQLHASSTRHQHQGAMPSITRRRAEESFNRGPNTAPKRAPNANLLLNTLFKIIPGRRSEEKLVN